MIDTITSSADAELARLRRGVRDLAAVALLHGLWEGRDVDQVSDGLCGTVYRLLDLDVAAVRMGSGTDTPVRVYPPETDATELLGLAAHVASSGTSPPPGLVVHAQDFDGTRAIVVGRSNRADFPSPIEAMIFRAVANEAAIAVRASRRLAEARTARRTLEAVIEQMPIGIIIAEAPAGRIAARNAAFDRMVAPIADLAAEGFKSLHSLSSAQQRLQIRRVDGRPYLEADWPLVRSLAGEIITAEEVTVSTDGGHNLSFSISSAPVLDPDGRVMAAVAAVVDVSARREADAVREAFISMLSHELRTPVTAIYAGAQLLLRRIGMQGVDHGEIVEDIAAEAERLDRIVQNFLVLARVDRGAEIRGHEPVLIQRLVPRMLAREAQRWPDRSFVNRLPADLPPVAADESSLELVIRNLVNNAAKYAGTGSTVEVYGMLEGAHVRMEVVDDGPGLAPEEADRVFSLFYRSPGLSASAEGAGVGLYVVRATVAAMNGTTWAAPRPGGGAAFGFSLPVWVDAADLDETDPHLEDVAPTLAASSSVIGA